MCYAFVALTAGLLVACGGGGGAAVTPPPTLTLTPPPPPPPPFVLPTVTENGQPVEGIHYIRADDDSMRESELTDAEGKVDPRLPDNTESAQIIFAVGPITRSTVRNGERIFDFDTENGGFEIGRVSRPTRGWSGIDLFSGDLLECVNCERYLNLLMPNTNPAAPPNGLMVSPFELPAVTENGQPVEGVHYIRSDDDSMLESEPTDTEGKVNPRLPDNTESAQIIFAVGPITPTVRNGIREFDFDTENVGFEIGRVSRPTRGWSGIDLFSGDLLECTDCERYRNRLIPNTNPAAPPNGLTVSPFVLPAVTKNGQPVEGVHYIRSDDDSMLESEPTDAEGKVDPRLPDNTAAQIIFAVGPITPTVRNGIREFDFDTENGGFEIGRVSRPIRGWSGIDLFSGGLLECVNCERYIKLLMPNTNPAAPPNGLMVSLPPPRLVLPPPSFVRPVVTANGQPVEGIHYIRADDDSRMRKSELTDAEGRINPRLPDNTESAQIIFAVGPITLATVRNGIRIFDFDTENGGFEIGRVSRPINGWSGIDLLSRDLPECTDCDNYKRYLASLIRNANPEAPPNGLTVSRFLRPRVMYRSIENPEDTYPVAGIHYIQQDDIQLTISALTTVDGSFDGLFFDASPDATTVRSMPIIFAVGSINRVRHDPMPSSIVYDYQNDGFPLGTLTVTSAPRDWHNATIWIQKSSEGDLLFIGPNARITIATIAGTENGDKRLLASLVDGGGGGKEISLFVRPRFFYEGAAVQSVHYLRALDDEMTVSRWTTETVAMDPTPRQLGAFDVLLTINDEYDDPPAMTVGEIFASEEILFALGGATAVYDSSGVPTYSFDGDSGHVSLATVPAAGRPWSGRVVSITHDEGNRLLAESGPATVAIEDETTIKRFLVGVGDGVSGDDRIIDLFTPPRIMHRRDSSGATPNPLANIHYIRVHTDATMRSSFSTDDHGSFDPLVLRRDPHSLYVEKAETMHFGVGPFTRDAADLCRFQSTLERNGFESGEGGGFEMGETEPTGGEWSGVNVFVEPGDGGLGSDLTACDGLPAAERARLFVASLGDNPEREKGLLVTPFLYPRFLHGGEPTQNVDYIRVNDKGNPTMTVSVPTDENGFFDPLQISVYDKDNIQIEQMLFGLGVISVISDAPGYAFDDPAYGFQIGTAPKADGWSGRDIEIDAPSYQLVPLAGTTIDLDDVARFRTYNIFNPKRKVANIESPGVPRLDLPNLPNLVYDDGDRGERLVSGVHYIRVGDPQMRASLPTDDRGGFVPTGATVGIVGTVLFATREIVAEIDRVNMTIGYEVKKGTFLGAVTLGSEWDGRGLASVNLDLWRDKNYRFSDLTGVSLSSIFVSGKTPTRIDYLAFEFFIDGPDSDKYPRFHYDSSPLSRLHYYARPATVDAAGAAAGVTRPNGIFDPLHNGKEVGTVYFATAPIAVADGAPSFAPTSFIGAYTVAVDEDILTSEFRSEVLTFVDLVSLDGVPKRVDWLVLDLFAGRADKLPRLHYNDAPVANIHYLRDGAFQSEPILDDGFFNPIGNGGGEATPVYFATSPIKVENGNPVFASKTFLGAIASSLATDSDPETSDFREMTLGFDELEDYGGNSRPDPLILERALGIASYPRLLYGVSDGYTPDESNVIGLHYMRVGDGDMARSDPTDENGRFDPIMTDGRQAGTVIFGYRAFEFDGVEYQFQEASIGDEFNVGFQVGAAPVPEEIPGGWGDAVLNLGYAGQDWRQLALANTELTLNALCRLHDRGTRGDKGWNFGEDDNINPQNPTRLRRGDVDGDYIHGIYYRRLNDEFFPSPQSTSEDGYVLPYRFDEAKNICARDELVFSVGEEEIVGGEYVLKEENNLVGYDRFYVGHLSESDTDVDLEISDLGPLPSSALLSPPRPENYEERLGFVLVRQSGHNTRWETASPLFLLDDNGERITHRELYYYFESEGMSVQYKTGPNGEIRVASKSGSKSQILPRGATTIHFSLNPFVDDNCEINAIDPTTIETEDSTSQTGGNSGADCNRLGYLGYLVDPDSHTNLARHLIITGSLDDLMSGLFPPIFVDAPVAGISYLPIFDGDDNSPQLVSVSNLSESGGGFRPNGASQVLFALGTISLSSGSIGDTPSLKKHFLPVLFASDFPATITLAETARTVMFQKGVSVVEIPNAGGMSVRQLTLNTDDIVALGVVQRPLEGWARAVFTPHDLGAFAHQSDSIVGSHIGAARFLQMLDPDFPREEIVSGVLTESPPEDQEIVISTLAVSWLTETPGLNILSEKEAKATCGDNTTGCESIYNSAISLVYLFRLATGEFQFRMSRPSISAFELVPGDTPDGDMDLGSGQGKSFASSEFLNGVGYIYPGAETPITISVSGQTLTLTVPSRSEAEERLAQGVALVMDRIAPPPFRSDSPDDITLAVSGLSVMFPYGIADRPAARISIADAYSGVVIFDEKTGEIRFPNISEELLPDPEDVEFFNSLEVMIDFSYGSGPPVSRRIRFRLSDDSPHATP